MTWNGATLYKSADGGTSFDALFSVTDSASIGVAVGALGDFKGGNIFDEINSVDIQLRSGGPLIGYTELQVLNGSGLFVLGASGRWEVLQYKTATLIDTNKYRLSGLLRGRRGTEWAMRLHEPGDKFVLASLTAWNRSNPGTAEIGLERQYKGVTARAALSTGVAQNFTNTAVGLECYSPVQLGFGRDAEGSLTLTWIRRTRVGGEWRDNVDVPLGEASERYVVEVMDDTYTRVIRTSAVLTAPTWTYTYGQQVGDIGELFVNPHFKIYQISEAHGRGSALYGSPAPDEEIPDPELPYVPGAPDYPAPPPPTGATYGPWTMLAPMSEARSAHAAFVVGDRILHVAGIDYAAGFITNDGHQMWLDPATGSWAYDVADGLPGSVLGNGQLACATTFAYGGTYYSIGRPYNLAAAVVWEYDPDSTFTFGAHWRQRSDILLSWDMSDQYGALHGDIVYYPTVGVAIDMLGGAVTSIANIKTLLGYTQIRSYSVSEIGGLIYVLGVGDIFVSGETCVKTYVYDPAMDTLTAGADSPQPLWGVTSVVLDGKIHVMGGAVGNESFVLSDRHLIYDPAMDSWEVKSSLPPIVYFEDGSLRLMESSVATPGRAGFSAVAYDGKIYLAGGNGFSPGQGGSLTGAVSTPSQQAYAKLTLVYDPSLDV